MMLAWNYRLLAGATVLFLAAVCIVVNDLVACGACDMTLRRRTSVALIVLAWSPLLIALGLAGRMVVGR